MSTVCGAEAHYFVYSRENGRWVCIKCGHTLRPLRLTEGTRHVRSTDELCQPNPLPARVETDAEQLSTSGRWMFAHIKADAIASVKIGQGRLVPRRPARRLRPAAPG